MILAGVLICLFASLNLDYTAVLDMSSKKQHKSQKRMRGIPVYYDELKKKHTVTVTDTAWKILQDSARQNDISVGELIERWARSQVD